MGLGEKWLHEVELIWLEMMAFTSHWTEQPIFLTKFCPTTATSSQVLKPGFRETDRHASLPFHQSNYSTKTQRDSLYSATTQAGVHIFNSARLRLKCSELLLLFFVYQWTDKAVFFCQVFYNKTTQTCPSFQSLISDVPANILIIPGLQRYIISRNYLEGTNKAAVTATLSYIDNTQAQSCK